MTNPTEAKLEEIIVTHLAPIASQFARKISLTREDREDALNQILAHMADAARPAEERRKNERTGEPVAGFPGTGKAFSYFYSVAKRKSQDILKSRCRRWQREGKVLKGLIDFGELVTMPEDHVEHAPVEAATNREAGSKFMCLGLQ